MIAGFFQPSVAASRTAADWASPPARVKYLTTMLEQSEYIPGTAPDSATESSLTDLTRTPSLHGTSSSKDGDSFRSTSPKSQTEIQRNKKARPVERAISQDDKDLPENGPASNTRSKSSQRSKSVTRGSVLRPVPHNTQESLIFSRRRSKGKLYTALRTKVVDWDEDLRASDGSLEPQPQEDADFTSVSSPSSSGARYTFNKSSTGSWTSSARKKQATKIRRQSGTGSKMKPRRRVNNKAKHLLTQHMRSRNGNNQCSPNSSSSEKEPDCSTAAGKHDICNGISRSLASESLAGANNSSQACKTEDISTGVFKSSLPQNSNNSNRQSMFETSLREGQHLHGNTPGRGQSVAEKLIAALRESDTPNQHHNDINANEQLSCDNEHGIEDVTESHEMQNEPDCCKSTVEQQQCKCDKQDVIDSWTSAMSQEGISGDELYPVRLYSGNSSDESRFGSSQGPGEHNRILRKGEAMSGAEDGEEHESVREAPSLASSSSVEPLSTESTPKAYYSSPSMKESTPSLSHCYRGDATTAADRFEIHQPPPKRRSSACRGHSEAFALSSSLNLNLCATHPEEITTKDYCSRNPRFGNIGAARPIISALGKCPDSDITHATEFLESSAKTIVDKNGSPRLMQQASMGAEEHLTLKRQDAFPRMGQRSRKRTRGISQDDKQHTTYHTTENQTSETPCTFQLAPRESDTDFSASRTTLTEEMGHQPCASHPQVSAGERHLLKVVASVSPGSRQEEQHQIQERVLGLYGSAAAAEPEQNVAFELSKSTAGQINWQTTLQELRVGMERTLRNNNEYLFRQIESEKATVNEVLNGYRKQCHSVLDQLFKAQIERTRLCKQQIDSIKQQHADVCQELIRRLKENERTLADWESQ
ncbi:hypothetical protein AN0355.2 [Aspergillus nidulans FGSC A4]|uniref:Uncharacterized protein n=1 Tax=Emericella nidulans (strain FGSC A4 / ATCC 38163 / CBS 112.46 / NRRL 194 / M139) TaxID=227321 RepID=Q5BGH5_EMENI|nr:hypothetical protein [Aspergillus nidulans FGSC A4]EAA65761.1 hypothetical protein AN0355.2 [Aspergillus nidulans FGSC A4]CBF89655.1 TPA: conserved hypothetical protein [Aspergillus nidulans FGSC A4]|eukprot:XP_657959.1 hypothetical protein AN0355.2 [Aspergillus nidulans FGSC A4]